MRQWIRKLALGFAALALAEAAALLAPWQAVRAAAPSAPPASAPEASEAAPALWVVKDEDTTIYLFGTVHVLRPGLGWFDKAVKDAFDRSDALMTEVVFPEDPSETMGTIMPIALDQTGTTLTSRMSGARLDAFRAAMTKVGAAPGQFEAFEPWFVAMTLPLVPLTQLGYDASHGVERQLLHHAKKAGKPVLALETLPEQLGYLDTLPLAVQMDMLDAVINDIDGLGPQMEQMVRLWAAGDPDGLEELLNKGLGSSPEVAEALLHRRNLRWAEKLKARMDEPGTLFVAVGAGHLAGDRSLQVYLANRGLEATRIDY